MDELTLVTSLRPAPTPDEADKLRRAARTRLAVACSEPRRRPWRRPVILAAAATALAGVALTAVMITEGRATPPRTAVRIVTAAWTVRANPDLTVTVTISQLRDPAGLQRALQKEGVPAIVRYTPMVTEKVGGHEVTGPACYYNWPRSALMPPATQQAVIVSESELRTGPQAQASPISGTPAETTPVFVVTISPAAIPAGAVVFLQASMTGPSPATAAPMPNAFGLSLLASGHLPQCVPFSERHGQADQR